MFSASNNMAAGYSRRMPPSYGGGMMMTPAGQQQPPSKTDILLFQQLANPSKTLVPESTAELISNLKSAPPPMQQQQRHFYNSGGNAPRSNRRWGGNDDDEYYSSDYGNSSSDDGGGRFSSPSLNWSDEELARDQDNKNGYNRGGGGGPPYSPSLDGGEDYEGSDIESPISLSRGGGPNGVGGGGFPMPSNYAMDPEVLRVKRQSYIQELMQLQQSGHTLSIEINDATPISALRSEIDLIHESISTQEGVQRLRVMLGFVIVLIEAANRNLLRGMLPLDGWSKTAMAPGNNQFDIPLRRIHNMYFRNSFGHPIMQLAMALGFSAVTHMMMQDTGFLTNIFGNISSLVSSGFGGGAPSAAAASPAAAAAAAAPTMQHQQPAGRGSGGGTTPFVPREMGSGSFTPHVNNMSTAGGRPTAAAAAPAAPPRPRTVGPVGSSSSSGLPPAVSRPMAGFTGFPTI